MTKTIFLLFCITLKQGIHFVSTFYYVSYNEGNIINRKILEISTDLPVVIKYCFHITLNLT